MLAKPILLAQPAEGVASFAVCDRSQGYRAAGPKIDGGSIAVLFAHDRLWILYSAHAEIPQRIPLVR
jgi:hypothetical protein